MIFTSKTQKCQETQENFPKTQAKFLKNSIYRKLHSPKLPPKRRKKTPCTIVDGFNSLFKKNINQTEGVYQKVMEMSV